VIPLVIPEEWKLEKEEYLVFDDGSVDTFKPKDIQKVDSFKPKEMVPIKCPGCGSQMEIAKLNKMQDVKCDSCGLAGEIKK
jgi:DNA-directed RNA polymerase subunit RPC12/RpoP